MLAGFRMNAKMAACMYLSGAPSFLRLAVLARTDLTRPMQVKTYNVRLQCAVFHNVDSEQ